MGSYDGLRRGGGAVSCEQGIPVLLVFTLALSSELGAYTTVAPDSGPDFRVKVLQTFKVVSFACHWQTCGNEKR